MKPKAKSYQRYLNQLNGMDASGFLEHLERHNQKVARYGIGADSVILADRANAEYLALFIDYAPDLKTPDDQAVFCERILQNCAKDTELAQETLVQLERLKLENMTDSFFILTCNKIILSYCSADTAFWNHAQIENMNLYESLAHDPHAQLEICSFVLCDPTLENNPTFNKNLWVRRWIEHINHAWLPAESAELIGHNAADADFILEQCNTVLLNPVGIPEAIFKKITEVAEVAIAESIKNDIDTEDGNNDPDFGKRWRKTIWKITRLMDKNDADREFWAGYYASCVMSVMGRRNAALSAQISEEFASNSRLVDYVDFIQDINASSILLHSINLMRRTILGTEQGVEGFAADRTRMKASHEKSAKAERLWLESGCQKPKRKPTFYTKQFGRIVGKNMASLSDTKRYTMDTYYTCLFKDYMDEDASRYVNALDGDASSKVLRKATLYEDVARRAPKDSLLRIFAREREYLLLALCLPATADSEKPGQFLDAMSYQFNEMRTRPFNLN